MASSAYVGPPALPTNFVDCFSLRNLVTGYSGNIVRVRRSSDNTEQNFTATQITDGTLTSFVGAGNNGFVTTWYNQVTGRPNLTQTNNSEQPRIVTSGSLNTANSKPTIYFNQARLFHSTLTSTNGDFYVLYTYDSPTFNILYAGLIGSYDNASDFWYSVANSAGGTTMSYVPTSGDTYVNNVLTSNILPASTLKLLARMPYSKPWTGSGFSIGYDRDISTRYWEGNISEACMYDSSGFNQSTVYAALASYFGLS